MRLTVPPQGDQMKYSLSVVLLLLMTIVAAQGQEIRSQVDLSGTSWILERVDKDSEATCIVFKKDGTVAIAAYLNEAWSPYAYKTDGFWKQDGSSFIFEFPDGNNLKIKGTFEGDRMLASLSCSGEACRIEADNRWVGAKQTTPPHFSSERRMISPKFLETLPDGRIMVIEVLKVSAP
jgi:hypothetical protein